jgi:hypothetical protein
LVLANHYSFALSSAPLFKTLNAFIVPSRVTEVQTAVFEQTVDDALTLA